MGGPHEEAQKFCREKIDAAMTMQMKELVNNDVNVPSLRLPEQKRVLNGHIRKVQGLSWADDSCHIIASDQGGKTIIWDAYRRMKTKVITKPFTVAVAMHPSRPIAAIGGMDNAVTIWSTENEGADCTLMRQLERHDGYISSLKFVGEDQMLSAAGDAEVALWDLNAWKVKTAFYGHEGDASCIRFPAGVPGSHLFCTSSSDGTVRVWDLRNGDCTHKFDVQGECNASAFFPNGTAVAAGSHDGSTYLFDLRSQTALQRYPRKNNHVSAVEFSRSGRTMFVAYEDGHVCLWDPLTNSEGGYAHKLAAHVKNPSNDPRQRVISCMSLSPDGTCLATGAFDSTIRLWGPATGGA